MMRWWWFGPAVTHEELLREMQVMKEAGIGGFEVQPVYPLTLDVPGDRLVNLPYLSPEFLEAVHYTASTAHQLGLRMDITLGSGWPFGGPHISLDLAAGRLRCVFLSLKNLGDKAPAPKLNKGERLVGAFVARADGRGFVSNSVRELSTVRDGQLFLPQLPSGPYVALFFIAGRTQMMVKRAAIGAEGLVLDHYKSSTLEKHLAAVGEPLVEAAGLGNIRAAFCDSFEVEGSDWTDDLLEEFRRRRGYDLKPYLPALVGDIGGETESIRHDWGETLTELFNERFLSPFQKWSRRHQMLARVQAYGEPPATLSSYRFADLPEGEQGDEGGRWNDFTPARWASSGGHVYGASVVSGETWTWVHSPVFRATPLDLKAGADEQFLEGVTQLVGHGWPYSPPSVPEPGWTFYAAGALNEHNPWWFVMPDLARYLQRTSFMLRQGRPSNDIALYLPVHDAWAQFTAGRVNLWEAVRQRLGPKIVPRVLAAGYNLDFVDDEVLDTLARIEKGKLQVSGQSFAIVVLPGIKRIPVTTLTKLSEFAQGGGILVSTRRLPSEAPGFLDQSTLTALVRRKVEELFDGPSHPAHFIADENQLGEELSRWYPPDFAASPSAPDIGFIHRSTGSAEIYFIDNTSNARVQTTATFRAEGKQPEWWDPFTGEATDAVVLGRSGSGVAVPVDLDPYRSRLLVFRNPGSVPGKAPPSVLRLSEAVDLSQGWEVAFDGVGGTVHMDRLLSWTDLRELEHFSGRATYYKRVLISAQFLAQTAQVKLNFGEPVPVPLRTGAPFRAWVDSPVREAAEVYVNDRQAGTIWHPPYELNVRPLLRSGENDFKIVVGNLAVNEMAGRPLPNYKDLEARYGQRFSAQDIDSLQSVPSGLLGPIRLIPERPQELSREVGR